MKLIVPFVLFMAAGCILCMGCLNQTKTNTGNVSTSQTFTSFTIVGAEEHLKISLDGTFTPEDAFIDEYPVFIDNLMCGVVATKKPITVIENVGNHTVKVCCNTICEYENVTIKFGKHQSVDFSERLRKDLGSSKPSARIIDYYQDAGHMTINVELINPTTKPRTMSADVSCGYTYIEGKTNSRVGSHVQGHLYETVNACDRTTKILNFNLASGSSYFYDIPTITLGS